MTTPAFEMGIQQGLAMSRVLTIRETDPTTAVVEAAKGTEHENSITSTLDAAKTWHINAGNLAAEYKGMGSFIAERVIELSIKRATVDVELEMLVANIVASQELLSETRANEQHSRTELHEADRLLDALTEQTDAFYESLITHINDIRTATTATEKNSKLRTIGIAIDDMTIVDDQGKSPFSERMLVVDEARQDRNTKKTKHDYDTQRLQLAEESYALAVSELSEKEQELDSESDVFKRRAKEIDKAARHAIPKNRRTKWLGLVAIGEPRGEA